MRNGVIAATLMLLTSCDREPTEVERAQANIRAAREGRPIDLGPIDMSVYSGVHEGMTYEEVRGRLARSGEELSSNEIAGIKTVMYQWSNPDGSNMNAIFQNGRLVQKAQFGLK
ncbi:hypothetical protein HRJ34_00205 [Rhizorhabdus wittichii]|uniref:DUF3862 domain-containing protein n=1 Tax=Rhizorhabdus wittichii TaxID=160791 RepID=A0A975D497_9SPHN|nr:hypothetical protein [Rhizorhabdus wittichii]QTH22001.1 hypothetical protein HRJ34_00205 [Rhizorhabdus wittichii]